MCKQRRRGKHCAIGVDFDGSEVHEHFSHPTDAKEFEFVLQRNRERVERELAPIPLPYTFGTWVEDWLKDRRKKRPRATWEPEEARLRALWLPRLKDRKIATIFSADIAKALERVIRDGRSNATHNRHRNLIHSIFEDALRKQPPLVLWNPVKSIAPLPENWRSIDRVIFTEKDLQKYVRAAKQIAREYRLMPDPNIARDERIRELWRKSNRARGTLAMLGRRFGVSRQRAQQIATRRPRQDHGFRQLAGRHWHLLAELFAGGILRPLEAIAVTADDFEGLEVLIEKIYCKTEKRIVRRTKGQGEGGGYRSLVMPAARHVMRLARITLKPGALISGGMTYDQARRLHRMTLERAGLPPCGLRVFRHSVARILKTREGFSPSEIQELLGHESLAMTPRYTRTGVGHLAARLLRKKKRRKRGR